MCGETTFCSAIHLSLDTLAFQLPRLLLLRALVCDDVLGSLPPLPSGRCLAVDLWHHGAAACLLSGEPANLFPEWAHHFTLPPAMHEASHFSAFSLTCVLFSLVSGSGHPRGCEVGFWRNVYANPYSFLNALKNPSII